MNIKFIIVLLSLSTIISVYPQNGQKQFEKCYDAFKDAETLIIVGTFRGYGNYRGKIIEADGIINLVKDKLKIVKYKSTAKSEVALLEKKYKENVLYDGSNVYIYDQENRLLNKGSWEGNGKNYIGYSSILFSNIEANFETFSENKSNITITSNSEGYSLSIPHTSERGEINMYFKTGRLLPYKITRFSEQNNNVDFIELHLNKIESNLSHTEDFFKLEKFIKQDTAIINTVSSKEISNKPSNSFLLPIDTIAPDWELINHDGVKRKLNEYKGKVIVMDFWATWCAPCVQAQPMLQSIHEEYTDVVVLGMNFNDKKNIDLNSYRTKKKLNYEMILNAEKIGNLYKVLSLPTAYVIDKSGRIVYSASGYSKKEEELLVHAIQKALK